MNMSKRLEYIDCVRGVAMILVVWGHCIQHLIGGDLFWNNPMHIFVCSFHVALFMFVSGLFLGRSFKIPLKNVVFSKIKRLLIPLYLWSIIYSVIYYLLFNTQYSFYQFFIENPFKSFWFLRSVFICYVVSCFFMKILKKDIYACVVSVLFMLILPDNLRLALDKYVYIFFWCGYFFYKYLYWILKYKRLILVLSIISFFVVYVLWQNEFYIYRYGMSFYKVGGVENVEFVDLLSHLNILIARLIIGLSGSIMIYLIIEMIYGKYLYVVSIIGKETLEIYVVHFFYINIISCNINNVIKNDWLCNVLIIPLCVIIVLLLSVVSIRGLNSFPRLSFWLFGRKYEK